jgi:hypothetical protein
MVRPVNTFHRAVRMVEIAAVAVLSIFALMTYLDAYTNKADPENLQWVLQFALDAELEIEAAEDAASPPMTAQELGPPPGDPMAGAPMPPDPAAMGPEAMFLPPEAQPVPANALPPEAMAPAPPVPM